MIELSEQPNPILATSSAPSDPEALIMPSMSEERYDFGTGEVVRITPDVIRSDESTGEVAPPLLYVQGMNGNNKLPDIMQYLAQHDKRPVIAVRYHGKADGNPKPVVAGMHGYRPDANIPELDVRRADDLLGALNVLDDVSHVSIIAESAGAVRALLVADELSKDTSAKSTTVSSSPNVTVDSVLLVDPAGQDGRSYRQTHFDALYLARAERRPLKLGSVAMETIADSPKMSAIAKQRRDRPDQRAVAYAQLQTVLAEVSQRVPVRVLSDSSDVAFRTERIADQMRASGAAEHAELIQTDKGGHGVGLNKAALDVVITNLHELERAKQN